MKRILFTLLGILTTVIATAQTPSVLRYYLNDGTTIDVKISELNQIQRIAKSGLDNIFNNGQTAISVPFDEIDSIVFVADNNVNRNTNPRAQRLEYPRLKEGSDQLLVIHSTAQYGITFSLEWDCSKRSQRWTCYQFHNGIPDNNVGRKESWKVDPNIPSAYQTSQADYSGSGFTRGHMCMSNDRQSSVEQNKQTFYYSNMQPQYSNHNSGLWQTLENKVNSWGNNSSFRDTLYVVKAATIDKADQRLANTSTGLIVPKYFYMAILCVKNGQYKAIGFWTEHTNSSVKNVKPKNYAVSIRELEEKTGIDFFCNLPDDIEETVESSYSLSAWGIN